ncbi:hypothetical protein BJV74DRAFT_811381 [Russula compacta]|nr:hypothetical protein BJV74DRAFT_811381 [Russula compacta]
MKHKALTDVASLTSSTSVDLTRFAPSREQLEATSQNVAVQSESFAPTAASPTALAWPFELCQQFARAPLTYPIVNGSMVGEIVPGGWHSVDLFDVAGPAMKSSYVSSDLCPTCGGDMISLVFLKSPSGCGAAWLYLPSLNAAPPSALGVLASPQMILGKGHRGADDVLDNRDMEANNDQGLRFSKRSMREMVPTIGVLEAGGSTYRTRHEPAAWTFRQNSAINPMQ